MCSLLLKELILYFICSVILGCAVKPMVTRDKPGLSKQTRFYYGNIVYQLQNQGFLRKPEFSIDIPGLSIQCFKTYHFCSKTWFGGEKPGTSEKSQNKILLLQNLVLVR